MKVTKCSESHRANGLKLLSKLISITIDSEVKKKMIKKFLPKLRLPCMISTKGTQTYTRYIGPEEYGQLEKKFEKKKEKMGELEQLIRELRDQLGISNEKRAQLAKEKQQLERGL